jgi:hypothetical protein
VRNRWHSVLEISFSLLVLPCLVGTTSADTLTGSVAACSGGEVRIKVEGPRLPRKGDPVKILADVPGLGKVPLQGNWTVARIDGQTVIGKCEGDSSAQPSAGQSVTIESTRPTGPANEPGQPTPPADTTPVEPVDPGHNGRPETRVYPPPMVERRPGPVPEGKVRVETDNFYLDVPDNWLYTGHKLLRDVELATQSECIVIPHDRVLGEKRTMILIDSFRIQDKQYTKGDVQPLREELLSGIVDPKLVKEEQIRSGHWPAWRFRVQHHDATDEPESGAAPAGTSRRDDDVYCWHCQEGLVMVVWCMMEAGEERTLYRDKFTEIVHSLRRKPRLDPIFRDTFQESDDQDQGDTEKPSTGRYMPGCDASEASKKKCKLADKMREQRRFDEAIRLYNEAIQLDRSHVCAYTGIGWALGFSGRTQSGLDQMNRTVGMFSHSAKAFLERGAYATRINRIDLAESDADTAIRLSYCAQAYELRARCYLERGRHQSAINYLDMAIKIFPDSANAYRLRARAHRGLRNYSQASHDDAKAQELEKADRRQ